jgi:glycosyltransferase involved in cell wall biosynthesis
MQPKILFIHSSDEAFVKLDRELLNISFELQDFYATRKFPAKFMYYFRAIKGADVLFCWFASWNSFWALLIARIFRKPSILVIGGYDVANLPIADYGHQRGGLKKKISRWAMGLASILIPFSNYSQREAEKNAGIHAEHMRMIYIGVPDMLGSLSTVDRKRMALTVGKVEWANLKRKGLEPFVRAAAYLPDVQFLLVGVWADDSIEYLRSVDSPNVVFTGRVSDEELLDYYRQASVYVQASLHEGFGLSVAEAMLAGCIPITTRAGSLPEVVGDCGYYCDSPEPSDIAKAIEMALHGSVSIRERARERILSNFPMEKRRKLLEEIIWSSGLQRNQAQDS